VATRILHLSDTHISRNRIDADGVDATVALEQILRDARHIPGIDALVVSGDIADDGSIEGCLAVREQIAAFAAQRGVPHIYCTGNHDDRSAFAAVLGSGHLGPDGSDLGRLADPDAIERAAVSEINGVRIVTLDSLVPGQVHGLLSELQLTWLRDLLAIPAPNGTVIVLHHPPIFLESSELMRTVGLRNGDQLASVIADSDVLAVLCGHFHLQLTATLAGRVPVWVTPGVVTRIDLTAPPHLERAVRGAGATVVDLGGAFSPTFHVLHARDPQAGQQVYLVDSLSGEDVDHETT
jgi:Icc protein